MAANIDWTKKHILKTNTIAECGDAEPDSKKWRPKIEPWLSAIFQSEHFSVLAGSGLTNAITYMAGLSSQSMGRLAFTEQPYAEKIKAASESSASSMERGEANLEDDLRVALELLKGYQILQDALRTNLESELNTKLKEFIVSVLATEKRFMDSYRTIGDPNHEKAITALNYLCSFLGSFASRAASRERLNIFTTNYDRFIEYGCDEVGILLLDRFKGKLQPIFRNTRLELDYHYNPPGIRGEPRYVEGVVRLTKLHGSIDWRFQEHGTLIRSLLPFGASESHPEIPKEPTSSTVIYPNSAKDVETAYYPYSELFRDFSAAICRQNSSLVTYGYGFGDSHINRIIADAFTIPSTHLVVISYDDPGGRIQRFLSDKNDAQYTLLLGKHYGDLKTLIDYYLPKSAIDRLSIKMNELVNRRPEPVAGGNGSNGDTNNASTEEHHE